MDDPDDPREHHGAILPEDSGQHVLQTPSSCQSGEEIHIESGQTVADQNNHKSFSTNW